MSNMAIFSPRGKVIRDAVHGDIFIPEKFLEVIDTPEFQRLRRIKQLSVANTIFPSADHTRFSHSLGTFYVMTRIISHFELTFKELGIKISDRDKEIALLAALLHDVGHGPFSHAFEDIHPEMEKNIKHEVWTTRIITDKNSSIFKAIVKNFGNQAPSATADLIRKQRYVKNEENYELESIDLFSVLSSLISSQLDADRLDYLLRDSSCAGVTFGKIDISRIIASLQITVYNNKYYVCVAEKFIQDIEAYLLARYQMQKAVYYHDFKIQMEIVIKLILKRVFELYIEKKLDFCPTSIKKLLSEDLSVSDYVFLDDSTFVSAFQEWSFSDDPVLSELCKAFLNREKSKKINVLDNSNPILDKFKQEVCALFKRYKYNIEDLKKEYFWIESGTGFSAYKLKKENIWVLVSNGLVVDISQVSKILKDTTDEQVIWQDDRNIIFINYNLLRLMPIENIDKLINELRNLVLSFDIRKIVEIEKKYYFKDKSIFDRIKDYLNKQKIYKIEIEKEKEQIDYYYDTDKYELKESSSTLRVRQKSDSYELTIKRPIVNVSDREGQNERFEFQKRIEENKINNEHDFIFEHLDFLNSNTTFKKVITIRNNRTPIHLKSKNIEFEMVFDNVSYETLDGRCIKDYQIEIELKSDYPHRVNLKMLTDEIEKQVPELNSTRTSKYLRGLQLHHIC